MDAIGIILKLGKRIKFEGKIIMSTMSDSILLASGQGKSAVLSDIHDNVERSRVDNCKSVIDMDGIEHSSPTCVYISADDWRKWVADGRPEYICAILSKDIIGPGTYYLAGSDFMTGFDIWKLVVRCCEVFGEYVGNNTPIPELNTLFNVEWIMKDEDGSVDGWSGSISRRIKRLELITKMRSGDMYVPPCTDGKSLYLTYRNGGKAIDILVDDKTSNSIIKKPYDPSSLVVCQSVMNDNECYVIEYDKARVLAEQSGTYLSVWDYFNNKHIKTLW